MTLKSCFEAIYRGIKEGKAKIDVKWEGAH